MTIYKRSNNLWRVVVKIRDRSVHRITTGTKRDAERLVEALRSEPKASPGVLRPGVPTFCDACPHKTKGAH